MPARNFRIYLINRTPYRLRKVEDHLDGGSWTSDSWRPPVTIEPNISPDIRPGWQSESDGVWTGTEGRVIYEIEDRMGEQKGEAPRIYIHWTNPYAGKTDADGHFEVQPRGPAAVSDYRRGTPTGYTLVFGGVRNTDDTGPILTEGWLELVPGGLALSIPDFVVDHAWGAFVLHFEPQSEPQSSASSHFIFTLFAKGRTAHSGNLIQSNFGKVGNYEMLVPAGNQLQHYWRDNDDPQYRWHRGHIYTFQSATAGQLAMLVSDPVGVSLLQSTIKGDGFHGNFDAIIRMRPRIDLSNQGDGLSFCAFDTSSGKWTSVAQIFADGTPIVGVTGDPALIQSNFGKVGNYEMLVPAGNQLQHYWRDNDDPQYRWHRGHIYTFQSATAGQLAMLASDPVGVSLLQSTIKGDGFHGNFDAIVRMRPRIDLSNQGDGLSFCAFDTSSGKWTSVAQIFADGTPIVGVTGDPALIQSNFGKVGNYEMLVPAGNQLQHYWRDNDDPQYRWHRGHIYTFQSATAGQLAMLASDPVGVSLLQSTIKGDGFHGNFDAIVRMRPRIDPDNKGDGLFFCAFDTSSGKWTPVTQIFADDTPILGVTGL